jgi:hypothetical protein
MFIGHTKSGGTLIGSLLDAHPNVILADEADVLAYMENGFSRHQIYHILLKISRREVLKGRVTARRLKPYSFKVPGQWQGRYSKLQVIGDSRAGLTTQKFGRDPDLLRQKLHKLIPDVDIKLIQVIRNPYDPISQMMIRGKRSFQNAQERYFANCEILIELRKQMNSSTLLAVKYEEFIRQPESNLIRICNFLGIDACDDYVDACTNILYESPEQSRHLVRWEPEWIDAVQSKIDRFDFLEGYTFKD